MTLAEAVRAHVLAELAAAGGNRTRAARELGVARQTLQRMLRRWQERGELPSGVGDNL